MGKKKHGHENRDAHAPDGTRLGSKEYQKLLEPLQAELVALQDWVKASGTRVVVVFEGRDSAGKGGVITAITSRVSPRVFTTVALSTPTDREKSQLYMQRYIRHLPAAGEVTIFDRSWYNRAGVERVLGFATPEQVSDFLAITPTIEKYLVDSGIVLLKYWLEVSEAEQERRLRARVDDPRKTWKLSSIDVRSFGRYYDYSRARDEMFAATHTAWAPWYVADAEDQRRARLDVITHLLGRLPYTRPEPLKVEFGDRQKPDGYVEPPLVATVVPAVH